jgi:VanZ family protein
VLAAAAISVVIEVLQTFTPRVSDPRDLLANTAGALVGALIAAIVIGIRRTVTRMREPVLERTR